MKKTGFTLIELIITIFVILLIVSTIIGFVVAIFFGFKGCKVIQEKGLKNVGSEIWNGTTNDPASINKP